MCDSKQVQTSPPCNFSATSIHAAPSSPSQYSSTLPNQFGNLTAELRTSDYTFFTDDFRPPTSPNTQPQSATSQATTVAPPEYNHNPPLQLPTQLIADIGRSYRVANQPIPVPFSLTVLSQHNIGIISLVPLKHITKTTRKKETR